MMGAASLVPTPAGGPARRQSRPVGGIKRIAKRVADGVALLLALPFVVGYWLGRRARGRRTAFEATTQALSLIPGHFGCYVRRAFLRVTMARCAPTASIGFGVLLADPRAEIGEHVCIGPNCDLGWVILENDVLLGSGVHVLSGKNQHHVGDVNQPIRLQGGSYENVRIGAGTWVGNGAIIMANIGRDCIIAAGAVVTHEVEDYSVAAGNPARRTRRRKEEPGAGDPPPPGIERS